MIDIDEAVEILKKGGVVIFPTDTVWGMGVVADNPAAIEKFYRIKRREKNKPTAILVADLAQAEKIGEFGDRVREVAKKFWPGALTIVVPSRAGGTVGLRVPDHRVIQELCRQAGGILAGSANFAGGLAPRILEEIDKELIEMVDMVMGGPFDYAQGQEASTVIDTTVKPWKIVRQGPVQLATSQ